MNDQNISVMPDSTAAPNAPINIDIVGWLTAGWNLFRVDIVKHIVAILIVTLVNVISCGILAGPMLVGYFACLLKKARGADFEFAELFDGFKKQFIPAFLLSVVVSVAYGVLGFIPFVGWVLALAASVIVPPIFSYTVFELAGAEESVSVNGLVDTVKAVIDRIKPQFVMIIVWMVVAGFIGSIGVLACCVGFLATMPISCLAITASYLSIFRNEQPGLLTKTAACTTCVESA